MLLVPGMDSANINSVHSSIFDSNGIQLLIKHVNEMLFFPNF